MNGYVNVVDLHPISHICEKDDEDLNNILNAQLECYHLTNEGTKNQI